MSAGDWYRWWGGAVQAFGGRMGAGGIPHPARLMAVERERVARRKTLYAVMWTVLLAGPFFATVTGGAVAVLARMAELSDRWFGVALAIPSLAMLVQLPGALLVSRVRHRPRMVFYFGVAGRLMWIPAAALPLVLSPGPVMTSMFLTLLVLAWVGFFIGGLAWQSFVSDLIPAKRRGKYLGMRLRLFSASNLLSSVLLAMVLPVAGEPWAKWVLFAIFCFASITGAIELLIYRNAYDPPRRRAAMSLRDLVSPLADRTFLPFLVLAFLVAASNGIVGPFLWRHFLDSQAMPPLRVTLILQTSALIGMMVMAPIWGAWADRFGTKATLWAAMAGGQVATLFWPIVSPELWWTGIIVMLVGVSFWTGVDVGLSNRLFKHGQAGGAGYFAVYSATMAVAGFGFTALGGELAERYHDADWIRRVGEAVRPYGLWFNVYLLLSILCIVLRGVAMVWLMYFIPRDNPRSTSSAVLEMAGSVQSWATQRKQSPPAGSVSPTSKPPEP